jgi:hypothetical protein
VGKRGPPSRGKGATPAVKLGWLCWVSASLDPTSYEASLVKLRVMTWSVVAACHMVGCSRGAGGQRVRGGVVPRAGRWLCRDALPTTSYPCRQGSPDTPFRVRHDKRVLDLCGRPIYDIGAGSHRPAQVGCGRPCPRDGMRHAIWLCSPPLSLTSFFCSTRAASILPSRPQRVPGAARRPSQGWPVGPPGRSEASLRDGGLDLDMVEHGARLALSGAARLRCRHAAALVLS